MRLLPQFRVVAFVLALPSLTHGATLPYRFEKVAETGPNYRTLGVPSLNDAGVMAFGASTPSASGVFYGTPLLVRQAPTPGVRADSRVVINNAGQIAFSGVLLSPAPPGNIGVYRYNPDATLTTITQLGSSGFVAEGPVMNDAGMVAYNVESMFGNGRSVLVGDGTGTPQFRDSNQDRFVLLGPHIDNPGNTVTISATANSGSNLHLSYASIPARTTTFTDPDDGSTGHFTQFYEADNGDGRRAVFEAAWQGDSVRNGLYVWDNGTISKVGGSDVLLDKAHASVPAINDVGAVAAFIEGSPLRGATLHDRLSVFQDGAEEKVIAAGDPFDGSTVTGLEFLPEGFNDAGQLAFQASLADGRAVNVLASLPEPGAVALLAIGGGLLLRRRSRD